MDRKFTVNVRTENIIKQQQEQRNHLLLYRHLQMIWVKLKESHQLVIKLDVFANFHFMFLHGKGGRIYIKAKPTNSNEY